MRSRRYLSRSEMCSLRSLRRCLWRSLLRTRPSLRRSRLFSLLFSLHYKEIKIIIGKEHCSGEKKNGSLRMCVDYRSRNKKTVKDAYALSRTEEIFDVLRGSKIFCTIDMKSGYHQVEITEDYMERIAFTVGPLGFLAYNRMSFGLSNSPATYQLLMEECLADYNNMTICVIYLDDLIVLSDTFYEHLEGLDMILTRLKH